MNPASDALAINTETSQRIPMRDAVDVFNGDADGLLARHQFRLTHPIAPEEVTLITGVKRDIALLDRIVNTQAVSQERRINVFDVSYDRNAKAAETLLAGGAYVIYFDHHRAGLKQPHPLLTAFIDESPDTCTSLLVDRYCGGAHRLWAIAAAFGDNLSGVGRQLAAEASLSSAQTSQLRMLGECLNYNAYGESVEDLHYHPAQLAARLHPYTDPFEFIEREDILPLLQAGRDEDLANALAIESTHASHIAAVYMLPDAAWARRVSGVFANYLVHTHPRRAHAVLTPQTGGGATVSIRAPASSPRDAVRVARRFENSGGREIAAGIESFPIDQLPRLVDALEDTYR